MSNNARSGSTSPFLLFLAWLIVIIPLSWGVYKTLLNALDLFK